MYCVMYKMCLGCDKAKLESELWSTVKIWKHKFKLLLLYTFYYESASYTFPSANKGA